MKVLLNLFFCFYLSNQIQAMYSDEINYMHSSHADKDQHLFLAVLDKNHEAIKRYIKEGSRFSYVDSKDKNALQLAASFEDKTVLNFLCCFAEAEDLRDSQLKKYFKKFKKHNVENMKRTKAAYPKPFYPVE